jgi:glycerophosphoryl diester phosphodiesterase
MNRPEPWPLPLWIAHRGAGRLAPENTLAAFRLGAAHGWRAFECDVKLSADGVPFLLHDAELGRTTDGQGRAGDRTWAELARLDAGRWHSPAHAGEPLARLDAVAAWVQQGGHALNLEIKPTPGLERRTGEAVGLACRTLWQGSTAPLLLSSFSPQALEGALQTAPALPRALLLDRLRPGWQDTAQDLGCVAVVTEHGLMDAALAAALHTAGLRALCYTVNAADEARRLIDLGVAGIISDAVDRLGPGAAG